MEDDRKRACALIRVSSEEQAKGGYGLEFQEGDIKVFCQRNNLELLKVFRDEGYSGATSERPGFQEMMKWARDRRFDVLVVWKLDRLFRDTRLTLQTIDELAALGIDFRSVQETITHDSNGRFLLTIFAAGAEKERKDITTRMYAGRIASAKRGTYVCGGGTPPYGYRYNRETKRLEIDEEEAHVVRQIFQWLVDEKVSLFKIQSRLNDLRVPTKYDRLGRKKPTGSTHWWAKRTIGRILTNEVYTGTFVFRKYRDLNGGRNPTKLRPQEDWITVTTPALVTTETFQRAQEQLRRNAENSPRRTKKFYLLGKLLVCGYDGRRMQAATRRDGGRRRDRRYYFCSGIRKGFTAVRCPSRFVSESRIAPPVWERLRELLTDPERVLHSLTEYRDAKAGVDSLLQRKGSLETQRDKVAERMRRLADLYLNEAVDKDFFQTERRKLKLIGDEINRELKKLESTMLTHEEMKARTATIQSLYGRYVDRLNSTSDQERREIIQTFVRSVVVWNEELEIEVALPPPDAFAGQPTGELSRKHAYSVFLTAKVIPVRQFLRQLRAT